MTKQEIRTTLLNNKDPEQAIEDFSKEEIKCRDNKWIALLIGSLILEALVIIAYCKG